MQIMLHGPPGTGKTSIIKAIANEMNLSILYVKLSEFQTFDELMDFVNLDKYTGIDNMSIKLTNKDKMFVFEDFDDEYKKVFGMRVKQKMKPIYITEAYEIARKTYPILEQYKTHNDFVVVRSEEMKKEEKKEPEEKKEEPEEKKEDVERHPILNTSIVDDINNYTQSKMEELGIDTSYTGSLVFSDLLQLFDGIIENRQLMVMTTNHIECFDNSLMRPGRITLKLHLGDINKKCIHEMLKNRYPNKDHSLLENLNLDTINPSRLEYICNNYFDESLVDFINTINKDGIDSIDDYTEDDVIVVLGEINRKKVSQPRIRSITGYKYCKHCNNKYNNFIYKSPNTYESICDGCWKEGKR